MKDIRIFIPAILISLTSYICPNLESSASNVKLRPPGWVFGVVWPILYLTTGLSWQRTKMDREFLILIASLCAWLIVYSCRGEKNKARYVLAWSVLVSLYILWNMRKTNSYWLMIPLTSWLIFATYLNQAEVTNKSSF
jgi:tryptophan-rich sensory protein